MGIFTVISTCLSRWIWIRLTWSKNIWFQNGKKSRAVCTLTVVQKGLLGCDRTLRHGPELNHRLGYIWDVSPIFIFSEERWAQLRYIGKCKWRHWWTSITLMLDSKRIRFCPVCNMWEPFTYLSSFGPVAHKAARLSLQRPLSLDIVQTSLQQLHPMSFLSPLHCTAPLLSAAPLFFYLLVPRKVQWHNGSHHSFSAHGRSISISFPWTLD